MARAGMNQLYESLSLLKPNVLGNKYDISTVSSIIVGLLLLLLSWLQQAHYSCCKQTV